jgi:TOMM system kinase/cyclase fusion protein
VAIKVLRIPEGRSREQRERLLARFEREARLCAELQHPNIVRLMDSGKAEGGGVYSVFEFIPGKTLAAVLEAEQRLHPVEARHLMLQVLDALACAHAQGVVHRDLKPENIMVVPTGARRNAVILDFGISALTEDARRKEVRITRSNEWLGTPVYAAPEQLRGERPLPRSDLYAWGLIFLECLTGQRPIRGAGLADVISKQLSPEPIPIPARIAAHSLGRALRRATEKSPEARDVTAEQLLRELDACDVSGLDPDDRPAAVPSPPSTEVTATMMAGRGARDQPESRPATDAPTPAARPSEGERRQVTVVCCALSVARDARGGADLDEIDEILSAEQDACAAIAEREGGCVGGALNYTMHFFFGYPAAREGDARCAARAALAMAAEVGGRGATIAERYAARVEIRVGVHTGMIVTRDLGGPEGLRSGRLGGATPQTATRLSALAQPGEVLVSGEARRLLRDRFPFEGRGALAGAGEQTDVYRMLEGSTEQGARDRPLVGRQRELDALLDRWSRVRGGAGQTALITGEPGIGKSRLTRALREGIGPHTSLEGRCAPDATNSPLYPIIDMLDRLLDPGRERSAEAKAEELAALLSLHGFDLAEAMPLLAPLLSLPLPAPYAPLAVSPQRQRELTHNAVLSLFFEMSERAPVLLVIEDLHWADPSTVELCAALVSETSSGRVLAVFTARPEFSPAWSLSAALIVQLGYLDRSDVAQLATAVSGGRALPPEVIERIAARTDGVPLFVEELVQMILESGALADRDGRLVPTDALDDRRIPNTLRGSLAARLDRLGPARETAQVAAAIGREFGFDLLRAVVPVDESRLREDLDKLAAANLIHHKRRLRSPAYVFKHALVQDTAYDALPKGRRREIHERIARALERDFPGVAEEKPEVLARHCGEAELFDKAAAYLLNAGQRALGRAANMEAIDLLERGITLLSALPESLDRVRHEFNLRSALCGALVPVKGYSANELMENLVCARALCQTLGDPPILFPVLYGLLANNLSAGRRAPTEAYAAQLLDFVREHPDRANEVTAHFADGTAHLYRGRFEQAWVALSRAVSSYSVELHPQIVRLFGDDHGVFALGHRAWVEVFTGQADQARASVDEARRLAVRLRNPLTSLMASLLSMVVYHDLRDVDQTSEFAEQVIRIATEQGFSFWRACALNGRGWVRSMRGDHERGIAEMEEALSVSRYMNQQTTLIYGNAYLIDGCLRAGRIDHGMRVVDESLAGSSGSSVSLYEPELLRLKGDLVAARAGHPEAAIAYYEEAIAIAQEQGAVYYELRAATSLASARAALGDRARARACLAEAAAKMREGHDVPVYVEAAQLLAELADKT